MRQGETIQHRGMLGTAKCALLANATVRPIPSAKGSAGTSVPAGIGAWVFVTDHIPQSLGGVRALTTARESSHPEMMTTSARGATRHLGPPIMQTRVG